MVFNLSFPGWVLFILILISHSDEDPILRIPSWLIHSTLLLGGDEVLVYVCASYWPEWVHKRKEPYFETYFQALMNQTRCSIMTRHVLWIAWHSPKTCGSTFNCSSLSCSHNLSWIRPGKICGNLVRIATNIVPTYALFGAIWSLWSTAFFFK